jgi:DNA-binding Lrp family transcriptional regulator
MRRDFIVDRLDVGIIRCLYFNSRTSYEELARIFKATPATIKNRIRRLQSTGKLGRLLTKLSCSAIKGQHIICIVETDGTENQENFIRHAGDVSYTEFICHCTENRYLAQAICRNIDEYSELRSFLGRIPEIISVDTDPINEELKSNNGFTKQQALILAHLAHNPRRKLTAIAEQLGKSSRNVSRAIRKLEELGLVEFTAECFMPSLFTVIKYDIDSLSPREIKRRLAHEFDCFWEFWESSTRPLVYACFFSEYVDDIHIIQGDIRKREYEVFDALIAGPRHYFSSIRDQELKRLIDRLGSY